MSFTLDQLSKLNPAHQAAIMADQARATAARERVMAQVPKFSSAGADANIPVRAYPQPKGSGGATLVAPPAKSTPDAVSAAMAAILPQVPGLNMVKAKAPKQTESKIQQEFLRWWSANCYEWQLDEELVMSIPNQGRRTRSNSSRMVAEGLRSGAPDVFAAIPRGDCAGLFIEFKASGGKLSENQRLMLARLTKAGYGTLIAYSAADAISALRAYLNLPTPSKS